MAKQGFRVIDSDMHVMEPADLWQRYLEPKYRDRAPVGTTRGGRDSGLTIDGQLVNHPDVVIENRDRALAAHMGPREKDYQFAVDRGWDGASQLEAMDREGIDVAVLFPKWHRLLSLTQRAAGRADLRGGPAHDDARAGMR